MIIDWVGCSNNIWYEWDLYKRMIYTKEKIRENKIWREKEREREGEGRGIWKWMSTMWGMEWKYPSKIEILKTEIWDIISAFIISHSYWGLEFELIRLSA